MHYFIGFLVAVESSLLLLDQRFYWRSMITISIFFAYAFSGFKYKLLREKIPNSLLILLVAFLLYFYINYDLFFIPQIYSRWGLTQQIYYLFSTPILVVIFLLILGSKRNHYLKEFIFSFSLTFAFLGFFLNITDYHGTENVNFLAVRFFLLIPILFIFVRSILGKILFFLILFNIILYFNSRTILVISIFFIFLHIFRNLIFSSKKIFISINFLACAALSIFPILFLLAFQEGSFLTGVFLSESKGVDGRFLIWAEILLEVTESNSILFGAGSNHDTLYYQSEFFGRNLSSHNMMLETVFRLGLVGYFLMIFSLFKLLNFCYTRKDSYSFQLGWISIICGMFLASLYEFIFFDGSGILNNIIFWFTLGTLFHAQDKNSDLS